MSKKYISLEFREDNKIIRTIQVIFGAVLILIAVYWLIFNIRSSDGKGSLWITLIFLTGFGIFQIYSGLGYAKKYIEFNDDLLKIRTNSLSPAVEVNAGDITSAEVFPLKVLLVLKSGKNILIRLGVTDTEKIEIVKDEFVRYVTRFRIPLEIKNM